ncbi:MAG: DUF4113 domain-containing protein [Rubricoccaceae bacterium]|nr:DUF4113 domain-containing protein [Rubricoccaceae bacterium]
MPRLFALVDCANFYVSCERLFDPSLRRRPVVVLSNNDGCVIARSEEARRLGVPMGAPFFQWRRALAREGVAVLSSNYTLYADLSRRVMETLETLAPDVEPYSIDEAFLVVQAADPAAAERFAHRVRRRVYRWTGIPVRVALAETKTLAKAGCAWAKGHERAGGAPAVCFWRHPEREAYLAGLPVEEVWGIAARWGRRLRALDAPTAAAFAALPDRAIRRGLSVVALRTAYELRGTSCIPLDHAPPTRKSLVRSRSFGHALAGEVAFPLLREALATHAARAAEKLRAEGLVAGVLQAFATTKGHGRGPHRHGAATVTLARPTNRTPALITAAGACLARLFEAAAPDGRPYRYKKAGVMLTALGPAEGVQDDLFLPPETPAEARSSAALLAAVDRLNRRFGGRTVVYGAMGVGARNGEAPAWAMARRRMSPCVPTRWDALPAAQAD